MKLLSQLFGRENRETAAPAFDAPLAPDATLAVIGDIHGCAQLLDELLDKVAERAPDRLVFVGDLVDRGEASAQVLERLHSLAMADDASTTFIKGNHEEMMLRFLDDPVANAGRWLRYGGLQTMASFGVGGISATPDETQAIKARDALARAVGPDILGWMRAMPTTYQSGNVAVVHAGANPQKPIAAQSEAALIWGHPEFLKTPRSDDIWVVHGHTIVDTVARTSGRIGVDTGAYATGRLSAALIGDDRLDVLTARY